MRLKSPTAAATAYLSAAAEGDLRGMKKAIQRSYPGTGGHNENLRKLLTGFSIVEERPESEVMVDVIADLNLAGLEDRPDEEGRFRLRCICEDRDGKPTPEGSWGVNPASMRKVEPEPAP